MKKRLFSMMMTLLLAFVGVAKAETVEIGTGTGTTYMVPFNSLYGYSFTEQVFLASEIGVAGDITSISFNLGQSYTAEQTNDVVLYMKNVMRETFSSNTDYETVTTGDIVYSGQWTIPANTTGWITITLDTPFAYDGVSNLMIAMHESTQGYSTRYFVCTSVTNSGISFYSDSYNPNPYDLDSYSGSKVLRSNRSNIQLEITPNGGGFSGDQLFAVQNGEDVETILVGSRPNGCWMEPFSFGLRNDGPATMVTDLDFTPNNFFTVVEPETPFYMAHNQEVEVVLTTGVTDIDTWQMVAIYGTGRTARVWDIVAEPYDPAIPDVWEMAYDFGTVAAGFSYQGVPSQITPTELHNDYTLPFPEIEEGVDAVYKFTVDQDMIISAYVDPDAENGKVALYTEDFNGEGGPMADNNYTGLAGGGAAAAPFEVQIGEGTSTTGYFPFYTLYNYSIAENLFLAAELAEAGVTSAPMTSLSWYATNAPGYAQQGITIWMANVEDVALTTTSHVVTDMTKVYTGAMTPAIGWNEFVFNEGSFAWDGHSNVLIYCQRNNGEWNSTVSWQAHNPGFVAQSYRYQDSGAYDPTVANTMYTSSTVRPNIIMKGGNRDFNRDMVFNFEDQQIPAGWNNDATYPWTVVNENGSYVMKSGNGGVASSSSTISATFDLESDGTISFDALCMGEGTGTAWDKCIFTLDGVQQFAYGAHVSGWNNYTYDVTAGTHTCTWSYTKDSSVNPTGDCFMVDNVTITSAGGSEPNDPMAGYYATAGPVIENLPLAPGTYYLVASATQADYDVFINIDNMPCPAIDAEGFAFNPQPADNEDGVEPASVTLRWMVPEYATGWRLVFGTTYYPEAGHPQTIIYPEDGSFSTSMANSYTVRNLYNNTNYFWRVEFNNDGCPDGVSSPVWGFTTHLNIPQNLTAVDETVFDDEQIVLNWNAIVDRTYRMYFIYRDGVKIGQTAANQVGATTYTDGPLAYNMDGYVYYVTAVYDEGESAPSNTVNVKVSGYGDVNGHVYEQDGQTGVAGATVTMVGRDEFNVAHTYNFTTNNQGYYSGHIYAGEYNGSASCNGYQTIDAPVQGNPVVLNYNQTTSPIDYMLNENYDPVCSVIAEYYPDSLDPTSPYVKVYWGCGLPGEEIVEPFETGDFSLFDWQIDPTYPWSITTYQPYEGTYCMKSGGAGVANVVSNMTVTVDIPADGIMSFFGKISCESSWDYGYFYIDGVQKGSYTGASSWGEKKFDITQGTHTFQWRYTKDGSVNSNDDCFYVDYITFYKRPEPLAAGWHTYCESEFNNAVGSNVGTSRWAYEYPVSLCTQYAGFTLTKVSLFSDNMYSAVGGNYTCTIYAGGTEPMAGTPVSTITVDVPSNQNAWVDFDLTTPVAVTGNEPLWVVWQANTTVSSWPAGCCDGLVDQGTWWSSGLEVGYGWDHTTYGTWTMRQYFNNRSGEGFYSYANDNAPVKVETPVVAKGTPVQPMKGQEVVTATCANPNAVKGAAIETGNTRGFAYYRVYRTDCYNDGPYTPENTLLLASEIVDTVYIDVDWPDAAPGIYKWGVGVVYSGNRGELYESPITWAAPVAVRDMNAEATDQALVQTTCDRAPWDLLASFGGTSAGQQGVATDGNYIYTASWQTTPTGGYTFYKYDMQGNFIEGFNIAGATGIRDLTYDGQYFYGSSGTANVFKLDLASHTLVGTINCAGATSRHCTYDPVRNGLWVGNWSDLAFYDMNGALQFTAPAPTSAYGSAYIQDEAGEEHLYLFCQPNSDAKVFDYNITTNTMGTTAIFDFASTPGFNAGIAGGCFIADYDGTLAFYGNAQQDPNLIGIYELRANSNPNPNPNPGNTSGLQEERESEIVWSNCLEKDMYLGEGAVDITVLLNSADSPEGVTVTFTNYNEAEQELHPVAPIVLDETGYYAFDLFRKGEYNVKVEFEGYETITDSVSIWDPTSLRYVMIEIIYGIDNLYVSSTGWAMWDAQGMPSNGGGGGGQGGNGDTFDENFDSGMPSGWTTVDADGDGYTWVSSMTPGVYHNSGVNLEGTGHNASAHYVISGSYANGLGYALTPDNFLVSPQVNLVNGSTFSFWACAQDASWAAEHFGVAISDNGTSNWTMVNEWTMTAKSTGAMSYGRNGETRAQGNWYNYTVDLSAYAGQKYIGIRHFNCTDMFILNVDDITLTNGAKDGDRHLEAFKVLCTSIDGEPIYNANVPADQPFCQLNTETLIPGDHYICKVAAIYSTGMSDWMECEWQYIPCDNYAGTINGVTVEGNEISWDYPGGGAPGPGPGQGSSFSVDFESGLPEGWTVIDGNNDGYTWCLTSAIPSTWTYYASLTLDWYHGGTNAICSGSYINGVGAITPNEWLVSPQVNLANGSQLSFWVAATDASYPADHFGVFVSNTGNNPSDFTSVQEWTLTAKKSGLVGGSASRNGNGLRLGTWYNYTVDLSNYAGAAYVAFRHFNCTDQYIMCLDDITLTSGGKGTRNPWDLMMTFTAPEGGHYGVAYDGNNFYTSNWGYSSAAHNFYKYDLQGNMLEGFEISGCGTLRGMTYDGEFFYGVANSSTVYTVDLANHAVVNTFTSSYGAMRGITYDPERDGFWVIGNWSGNLTLIDRTGAVQFVGPEPTSASDLAYYKDENDVEHVYCFNNGDNGVYDYNITTNTLGGSVFNFSSTPGYDAGSSGGCTVGSFNGKIAFIGDIQQSPNLIGIYELRDDDAPGPGPGPTPSGDILGAMIFADGEWEAFVPAPTNTYTYEGDAEVVCVRMVYNGTNNLPEGNIYYSMSCPECVEWTPGQIACEAGAPIHAEVLDATDQVKIWWGEHVEPIADWLYYDDGENMDAIGLNGGGSFYWGIKFPAASLANYGGCAVTKVAYYDYAAHSGVVRIYQGSNGNGPSANMIGSYNYTANGTEDWVEWNITPVSFDNTQDLWIVMNNTDGTYVAALGNYTGDPNGTMISIDGNTWYTLDEATGGQYPGTWNLRCYVTNQAKGSVQAVEMPLPAVKGGELANAGIAKGGSFDITRDRAELVKYNVYRSTDNVNYTMVGEVAEDGSGYYEYIDSPAVSGTYYYQVRAYYDNDCESEPAASYDTPANNYVEVSLSVGIGENETEVAVYPNPTNGNVTIEAKGMSHITVVSVLGQVVYDAEVEADNVTLNMSQFNAGMYTVRVSTAEGVAVRRVTVIR